MAQAVEVESTFTAPITVKEVEALLGYACIRGLSPHSPDRVTCQLLRVKTIVV
jgi:hypothetical protein